MKRLILVLALLFVLIVPAFAQDGDTIPTPVVTVEAPSEDTPNTSTDPLVTVSIWQIVAGLAGAFSLGGLTIGTGIAVLASRLRKNPETMAAIEYLAKSTPESTVNLILGLTNKVQYAVEEVGGLVREAFDKKPVREKTEQEREAVLHADVTVEVPTD